MYQSSQAAWERHQEYVSRRRERAQLQTKFIHHVYQPPVTTKRPRYRPTKKPVTSTPRFTMDMILATTLMTSTLAPMIALNTSTPTPIADVIYNGIDTTLVVDTPNHADRLDDVEESPYHNDPIVALNRSIAPTSERRGHRPMKMPMTTWTTAFTEMDPRSSGRYSRKPMSTAWTRGIARPRA